MFTSYEIVSLNSSSNIIVSTQFCYEKKDSLTNVSSCRYWSPSLKCIDNSYTLTTAHRNSKLASASEYQTKRVEEKESAMRREDIRGPRVAEVRVQRCSRICNQLRVTVSRKNKSLLTNCHAPACTMFHIVLDISLCQKWADLHTPQWWRVVLRLSARPISADLIDPRSLLDAQNRSCVFALRVPRWPCMVVFTSNFKPKTIR